jgi:ketosteroid isomerase-like protein
MSEENVEIAQRMATAWNEQDLDAFASMLDPEIEWRPAVIGRAEGDSATEYRGREGFWRWVADTDEVMDPFWLEGQEYRDLGADRVLVLAVLGGRGKASGVETRAEIGQVLTFRAGLVVSYRAYLDHAEALEAVGLSE